MRQKIKKHIVSLAAAALIGTLALIPGILAAADGIKDNPTAWKKVDGVYRNSRGEPVNGVVSRGIDVSRWQGNNVDWSLVAASDVDFVMFGLGRVGTPDPLFERNIRGAMDNNLKIGAYLFALAKTPEEAAAEAYYVLDQIKDYPISFPVAYDIEAETAQLDKNLVTDIIVTFCEIIREAGYYPMVYANETVLKNKIDFTRVPYDIWVARYNYFTSWPNPSMWQTTSSYYMDGITQNTVDVNFLFKDYSQIIAEKGWRHINGNWYYYLNYRKQTGWVNDGGADYYLNNDGHMQTGWLTYENNHYYLRESGSMVKGWLRDNDQWYYFRSNGVMAANMWVLDNGAYYFIKEDGTMLTGWHKENNKDYYLKSNGAMSVGWEHIDNQWYHFAGDGMMNTGWINDNGTLYFLGSNGIMETGWKKEGEHSYYLRTNGAAAKGWQSIDQHWYYFNQESKMTVDWIHDGNGWYYMNSDGRMASGWLNHNNVHYYLADSGRMVTGWRQIEGSWYYFDGSGIRKTGWVQDAGVWYYIDQSGKMLSNSNVTIDGSTYRLGGSGRMLTDWQHIDNNWYYYNSSGKMITGWLELAGKWYYLYDDGKMAANTVITINGITYTVDSDGVWIP